MMDGVWVAEARGGGVFHSGLQEDESGYRNPGVFARLFDSM